MDLPREFTLTDVRCFAGETARPPAPDHASHRRKQHRQDDIPGLLQTHCINYWTGIVSQWVDLTSIKNRS